MSQNKLFLLDGMALAYRAHFAFIRSNLRNSEGIPTGPIFGFANTIDQLLEEEKPTHIAVAWDTHAPTFRHQMDEQYKANRPPQPDELRTGIPLIKEMLAAFNIPSLEKDGYEADDIIGTLAFEAANDGVLSYLVTPDKDFMQLVTECVRLYKPNNLGKGFDIIDIDGVVDYFGVKPERVIDVLALIGDASDNIPGVPGIGKKGAPDLINEYGDIDNLLEKAASIKGKRGESLIENRDIALKARKMVTIDIHVPDTISWQDLKWKGANQTMVNEFFKRMQFRTLTRKYEPISQAQTDLFFDSNQTEASGLKKYDPLQTDYKKIESETELENLAKILSSKEIICIDTETTGINPLTAELLGISISWDRGKAAYILHRHNEQKLSLDLLHKNLNPILTNPNATIIAHNYKYDYLVLKSHGFQIPSSCFDTLIAAYLIDSSQKLSMDNLSEQYLQYEPIPIKDLIGERKQKQITLEEVDLDRVVTYACEDADITYQLWEKLKIRLNKDELTDLAESIEFPLVSVLAEMEYNGIKIDTDLLAEISIELSREIKELELAIYEKAGEEFNINSTQQMGVILFEKLGIQSNKKTATGRYATSEQVLQQLASQHEIVQLILDYRGLTKLQNTYVEALPKLISSKTGRIHTSFNQHIAATGRLSSSNPNLQNIPIRSERGRQIRKAFVAKPGYKILSIDYSQIELRVIASIANDEAMIEAFRQGEDIHARTAKEIFGLNSIMEVDGNQRRKAKEVNFGIPYGVSKYGLAQRLGIDNDEAGEMIEAYFKRFPKIKTYMREIVELCKVNGYVTTLTGRRRYMPDIHAKNFNIRSFAERTAINTPIQGTAADIIKIAMIQLNVWLQKNHPEIKMLLQVHDELVFEVPAEINKEVIEEIKLLMENAMTLKVPLKVEAGVAHNWLDAH